MTVIYCDVTGKEIEHATTNYSWRTRNRRYEVVRGRDFSLDGYRKLEDEVFQTMARHERFSFATYKKALADKIAALTD